jgi:ABC-type nitrate/sulfonate/bicarbonate transport system permease component
MLDTIAKYKGLMFLASLLFTWELVGQLEWVDPPEFFPPITNILMALYELTISWELPAELVITLYRSLFGLAIAISIAIPVGIWMGISKSAYETFSPTVEMLRPTPPAAIIPVAIVFFGIDDAMKLFVIVFGCIWPILINTVAGVRNLNPVLIETGKSFNLSNRQFMTEIVLRGASPYITAGIRISLAISIILAIVCEMIAGNDGLGQFIIISERSFKHTEMYAGIFAISVLGYGLNHAFVYIVDKHLMSWYRGYTTKI